MKSLPFTTLKKTIVTAATASLLMTSALSADCTYQLFTISSVKGTTVNEFVDQLSDECEYTVLIADVEAEKILNKSLNKTRIKNLTIDEVLNIILIENNLNYSLENNILKISFIETRTFNIDYILSQRKGMGSTDIITSKQAGSAGIGNATGGGSQGEVQLDEDGNVIRDLGESGVTIRSSDEVQFWEELDLELQRVLNRPEDNYQADAPIINKNSGMVTVSATVKQIRRLKAYLEELQKKVTYQVLIDVNLLAVVLNDSSTKGVDWSQLYALQNFDLTADLLDVKNVTEFVGGEITEGLIPGPSGQSTMIRASGGGSLNEVIKFLDTQGDVKAISNPKVLTLNNQPALITVGTEYFYSLTSVQNTQGASGGLAATATDVTINSVFAGVLLDITPEISHDGTITLKVNPSITQARSEISEDNTDRSMPPDLDRRQLSSVVTVKDGERVILGGLINTRKSMQGNQVPLLGDIPIIGWAFKWEEKITEVEELVMVIEPHIINTEGSGISLADLGYTGVNETHLKDHAFSMDAVREQMEKIDEEKPKEKNE